MVQQMEGIKRLTARVHFNSNKVLIGEMALQHVRAQHDKKKTEPLKKDKKKKDELRKRQKKAMEVRTLNRPEEQWTKPQFKAMASTKRPLATKGYQIPSLCFSSVGTSGRVDCCLLCLLRIWMTNPLKTSPLVVLNRQRYHQGEQHRRRRLPSF
jgi:hypothetical protein